MTTKSTYYHDGYRAALHGADCSPPDLAPFFTEYCDGYQDAMVSLERDHRPLGPNDTHPDWF